MQQVDNPEYVSLIWSLRAILLFFLLDRLFKSAVDPRALFSPKTLIAGMFSGFYILDYYLTDHYEHQLYFSTTGYIVLVLLAILAYLGFSCGFALGTTIRVRRAPPIHWGALAMYSSALILIGLVGKLVFIMISTGSLVAYYSAPHRTAGAWLETSGYLTGLPNFVWPGAVLMMASLLYSGWPMFLGCAVVFVSLASYAFEALLFGNRGDTISLFLTLVMLPMLIKDWFLKCRMRLFLSGGIVLVTILAFPYFRDALYLGSEQSVADAAEALMSRESVVPDSYNGMSGDELLLGAALVDVASRYGIYDLGKGWIQPLMNFVPRGIWPDKPYYADWSFSVYNVLPPYYPGWIIPPGTFPTGLADAFVRFSWFSIGAWFIFGLWGGRVWRRAVATGGVLEVALLWSYLMLAVYFVTQDFKEAWDWWLYNTVPVLFFSYLMTVWNLIRARTASIRTEMNVDGEVDVVHIATQSG